MNTESIETQTLVGIILGAFRRKIIKSWTMNQEL